MSNIRNVNTAIISGNLTKDPEHKQVSEKFAVTRLRVATGRRAYNSQTSQYDDKPVYISVDVLGAQANACAQHLHKGSRVTIHGEIDYAEWQAQDGGKRSEVRLIVDQREGGTVVFEGARPSQEGAPAAGAPAAAPAAMAAPAFPPAPVAPQPVAAQPAAAPAAAPVAAQPVAPAPVAPQPVAPQPVAPQPVAPAPVAPQPVAAAPVAQQAFAAPQPVAPVAGATPDIPF